MDGMREISMITLGVNDLASASKFYESLGFTRSSASDANIVWFCTNSTILGLYPWDLLAEDMLAKPKGSGFRGVAMAMNMTDKEAVDRMIEKARAGGAKVVKEPQTVFWGGYSSYFQDMDGHMWEVAWNPFTPVDADGRLDFKK